ncbi:hypothetical protein GCM10027037_20860 [Mucilaginibacter koreensis]
MKKFLLLFFIAATTLTACKKDKKDNFDPAAQAVADDNAIQSYIKRKNIDAQKDPSGVYYQVLTPGSGTYPTSTSTVSVVYKGELLDGTVFDSGTINSSPLARLIAGWQYGVPHINKGGRILLLIPSGLGYANQAAGSIPPNSVLVFTIDLLGFN